MLYISRKYKIYYAIFLQALENQSDFIIKKIAEKIKELRIQKGYTSYERFAIAHDLDRRHYWEVEKGRNITIRYLSNILQIHDISFADFFSDFE